MNKTDFSSNRKVKVIRWVARILGTVFVVPFLFIFIGGIIEKHGLHIPDAGHLVLSIFFLLGQFGLLISWRWEGVGSMLAIIGIVISILLNLFWVKQGQSHFVFVIYLLPAFMFLYCWWQSRKIT